MTTPLFTGLLVSVIVIVGALTFFPGAEPWANRRALVDGSREDFLRFELCTLIFVLGLRITRQQERKFNREAVTTQSPGLLQPWDHGAARLSTATRLRLGR